jgi:hypothetical protein
MNNKTENSVSGNHNNCWTIIYYLLERLERTKQLLDVLWRYIDHSQISISALSVSKLKIFFHIVIDNISG